MDMMLATSKDKIPIVCLGREEEFVVVVLEVFLIVGEEDSRRRACLRLAVTWLPIFTIQASATMTEEEEEQNLKLKIETLKGFLKNRSEGKKKKEKERYLRLFTHEKGFNDWRLWEVLEKRRIPFDVIIMFLGIGGMLLRRFGGRGKVKVLKKKK